MFLFNKNKLFRYSLQRLGQMIPSLLGIITLVFFMITLIPGDAARIMLGTRVSEQALAALRESLGLDKPMLIQFFNYIERLLHFDLGISISSQRPVFEEIKNFFPATLELSVFAILFASFFGILIGIVAALRRNTWIDYSATTVSLIGVSMPIYWLGLVMIMIFSITFKIFPTGSRVDARLFFDPITNFYLLDGLLYIIKDGNFTIFFNSFKHILLPSITLGMLPLAIIARITRTSMLEVLTQDYILTAKAMGYSNRRIIYRYALKNALLPIITVIGTQFGTLLSGAILTETIFAWPGLGRWIYHSISARDFPAVQGGVLIIALSFLLINFVVDVLYVIVNPKVQLT